MSLSSVSLFWVELLLIACCWCKCCCCCCIRYRKKKKRLQLKQIKSTHTKTLSTYHPAPIAQIDELPSTSTAYTRKNFESRLQENRTWTAADRKSKNTTWSKSSKAISSHATTTTKRTKTKSSNRKSYSTILGDKKLVAVTDTNGLYAVVHEYKVEKKLAGAVVPKNNESIPYIDDTDEFCCTGISFLIYSYNT